MYGLHRRVGDCTCEGYLNLNNFKKYLNIFDDFNFLHMVRKHFSEAFLKFEIDTISKSKFILD